jgi:hypothetical protein
VLLSCFAHHPSFIFFHVVRASCVGTSHCGTCRPLQQHPILQQYHELWGKGCGGSRLCRSRDCKLNSSLTGHPERQKQNTKVAGAVSNIGPVLWTESIDQPVLSDPSFFLFFLERSYLIFLVWLMYAKWETSLKSRYCLTNRQFYYATPEKRKEHKRWRITERSSAAG